MGPGKIHLEVVAGLANRIRALVAGIRAAEVFGRGLVIYWPSIKPECAASFYELFSKDSLPWWIEIRTKELSDDGIKAPMCLSNEDFNKIIAASAFDQDIHIKSYGCFFEGKNSDLWLSHLRNLKPAAEVKEILGAWKTSVPMDALAVHIRRKDNAPAIKKSPLDLFVKTMNQESENTRFIVFCDEIETVDFLKRWFGERILSVESKRVRHGVEGMREATAVFFFLAGSPRILGSACSSFSEIAAALGGAGPGDRAAPGRRRRSGRRCRCSRSWRRGSSRRCRAPRPSPRPVRAW